MINIINTETKRILENTKSRYLRIDPYCPGQGRPAELPIGGMSSTSGNKDSDAGIFYASACPGRRGNFGGG